MNDEYLVYKYILFSDSKILFFGINGSRLKLI